MVYMKAASRKPKTSLMVEGYMDVIALQQYGIHGAVATWAQPVIPNI